MYYLLVIYLIILSIFFVVIYVDTTNCTTAKLTGNEWGFIITSTLLWPILIWITEDHWSQIWWTFQLRRGKLLQSKRDPKTIIHYRKGKIYYWKTPVTVSYIRNTSWKVYHPITFKEL